MKASTLIQRGNNTIQMDLLARVERFEDAHDAQQVEPNIHKCIQVYEPLHAQKVTSFCKHTEYFTYKCPEIDNISSVT